MVAHTNAQLGQDESEPWSADSGANEHITTDLENLNITREQYQGEVEVTVGNGTKLQIANTGSAIFIAQNSSFQLQFVHCPAVPVNLLSIQKFCAENACLF